MEFYKTSPVSSIQFMEKFAKSKEFISNYIKALNNYMHVDMIPNGILTGDKFLYILTNAVLLN